MALKYQRTKWLNILVSSNAPTISLAANRKLIIYTESANEIIFDVCTGTTGDIAVSGENLAGLVPALKSFRLALHDVVGNRIGLSDEWSQSKSKRNGGCKLHGVHENEKNK